MSTGAILQIVPRASSWRDRIVAESLPMRTLLETIERLGSAPLPIILHGETGTGKEVIARGIHERSQRTGPFVAVNCAAIPESLAESELFGHVKGAFTGADHEKRGLCREADGGTLFLDEVAELSPLIQGKLLRVLEEGTVRPVCAIRPIATNFSMIAATHQDLEQAVEAGRFREDLFYRLNGVTLEIPDLRDRPEDIKPLIERFLAEATQGGNATPRIAAGTLEELRQRRWRGNVRELRQAVWRAVALGGSELTSRDFLPEKPRKEGADLLARWIAGKRWKEIERSILTLVIEHASSLRAAATALGIPKSTLADRIHEHRIIAPWMSRKAGQRHGGEAPDREDKR